jgi:H+/Cl- antiporter ClcA/K+/H+ antiporter YhaU regulatory subunit KhtT
VTEPELAARTLRAGVRAAGAWVGRWLSAGSYLRKWVVLGIAIGIVAGLGAVVFYEALALCTRLFLDVLAGYRVPTPAGEGGFTGSSPATHRWLLPLIAGGGALLAGLLVFGVAPEAEGHGTDAAISAVHHNPRGLRLRAVVIKIVASALTIGSGGSGGREGPTAQISAGFGSLLSRPLDLQPTDSRVAVATGVGSGIGAIFGAPLGGAVLAAEILYRDDFEPAALLPCFIASAASTVVFGAVEGFSPLFGYVGGYRFTDSSQLVWFALIGLLGGLLGLLYAKGFYGIAALFRRSPLPRWAAPAVGGLLVGVMAVFVPQVLGTGYGWVQKGLTPGLLTIPLWIVLILPFAKILATGLSIGSGGSGGIFGPGMVIGAFLGAAVWRVFEPLAPSMGHNPAPFVIIGMMCCFGGISRAPLAVMLMVAEMTGSLSMLAPAMIAVGIAWLIVRHSDDTIYRSQLRDRAEAPARRLLAGLPLLALIGASRAMARPRLVLDEGLSADQARLAVAGARVSGAPVVDAEGRFVGALQSTTLDGGGARGQRAGDLADPGVPTVSLGAHLDSALESLTEAPTSWVAVLDLDRRVVGTLSISDLLGAYRRELLASVARVGGLEPSSGTYEVKVAPDSPAVGSRLGDLGLHKRAVITSIVRGDEVVLPSGRTVVQAGDLLSLVGETAGLDRLGAVAPAGATAPGVV